MRVFPPPTNGPPRGPSVFRVSITRHGATATNCNPDALFLTVEAGWAAPCARHGAPVQKSNTAEPRRKVDLLISAYVRYQDSESVLKTMVGSRRLELSTSSVSSELNQSLT